MSNIGKSLIRGAQEALAYAHGQKKGTKTHTVRIPKTIDVKAIRDKLHMSRQEFAEHFGFSLRTLEKWEQGTRNPEGPTRAYLVVINDNPKAVVNALTKNH